MSFREEIIKFVSDKLEMQKGVEININEVSPNIQLFIFANFSLDKLQFPDIISNSMQKLTIVQVSILI